MAANSTLLPIARHERVCEVATAEWCLRLKLVVELWGATAGCTPQIVSVLFAVHTSVVADVLDALKLEWGNTNHTHKHPHTHAGRPKQGMFRRVSCKDGSIGDTGACWKEGREVSLVRLPACALSLSLSLCRFLSLSQSTRLLPREPRVAVSAHRCQNAQGESVPKGHCSAPLLRWKDCRES